MRARNRRWRIVVTAFLLVAAVAVALPAQAELDHSVSQEIGHGFDPDPGPLPEPPPVPVKTDIDDLIEFLAERYGLDANQALVAVDKLDRYRQLNRDATEALGSLYEGAWVSWEPMPKLIVAVLDEPAAEAALSSRIDARGLLPADVEVKRLEQPLSLLRSAKADVIEVLGQRGVTSRLVYTMPDRYRVFVATSEIELARKAIDALGGDVRRLVEVREAISSRTADGRGGESIRTDNAGSTGDGFCTTGFTVQKNGPSFAREFGFVTAFHCFDQPSGSPANPPYDNPAVFLEAFEVEVESSPVLEWSLNADAAFLGYRQRDFKPVNKIFIGNSSRFINGTGNVLVNDTIFQYGETTGFEQIGTVLATDVTDPLQPGIDLILTDNDVRSGDSGGPAYFPAAPGMLAAGLVVAGNDQDPNDDDHFFESVVVPIFDIEQALDVSVLGTRDPAQADTHWFVSNINKTQFADAVYEFGWGNPNHVLAGDWNKNGQSMMAARLGATWEYEGDSSFIYGLNTDIPLAGDFDDDDYDSAAYYRPSNGKWWSIDETYDGDLYTVAGAVTPIVGDWDGDGADSRGFFRHDGKWFLDSGPTTWFGAPGDLPVVGDWDGDDIDEIGVFRPTLGKWFLTFNFDGIPEQEFYFGDPGDIPVVGDWNENGVDTAAIVRHNQ